MRRRLFFKNSIYTGISSIILPCINWKSPEADTGKLLYNGIRLPEIWPPKNMNPDSYDPMPVPYLCNPPKAIPIDIGRQFFIDDFLIEETNLKREYHRALKYEGNPVLKPKTRLENGDDGLPVACPKDGGVWWDPVDKIFKMWYEAGWLGTMAYATSADGIHWERPKLNIKTGTNQILSELRPDSTTVFLDHDAPDPGERYKMFLRGPNYYGEHHGFCMVSPDGIHWSEPVRTGRCGDRSTIFYNPFRKKWIYSIRTRGGHGRARNYHEHSNFLTGAQWNEKEVSFWTGADRLDSPDREIGNEAQLYNLSAVGYESIILGFHQIHLGPPNQECSKQGVPKITELKLSFSRDGFHWYRPDRRAFIPAERTPGVWDRGYVQSVGGICTIVGDQLWFYYTGFKGDSENRNPVNIKSGMYAHGSTGVAILRRDGFTSMYANGDEGILTTRPVLFHGKYLFVNVDCPNGELKVEVLNGDNSVIKTFSGSNCQPVSVNSTIQKMNWKSTRELSSLSGKKVRFRFHLRNGHLYSFWISQSESGASGGYVASGGPGFNGSKDEVGTSGYKTSRSFHID